MRWSREDVGGGWMRGGESQEGGEKKTLTDRFRPFAGCVCVGV